jgi:hypothetical protein
MPRAYRTRATRPPLEEAERTFLLRGERAPGLPPFFPYGDARPKWLEHRAALLNEWIAEHPGTRPAAWWAFDVPRGAWREHVGGAGEQSAIMSPDHAPSFYRCDPTDPPQVESTATFLRRLGVLLPGEEERIPARAFRPVKLRVERKPGEAEEEAGLWAEPAAPW